MSHRFSNPGPEKALEKISGSATKGISPWKLPTPVGGNKSLGQHPPTWGLDDLTSDGMGKMGV